MDKYAHEYKINSPEVLTNNLGYEQLMNFYAFASKLKYTSIALNIWGIQTLDANLSCLLLALIQKLKTENKIYVHMEIPSHMNFLYRNGFFARLIDKPSTQEGERVAAIPVKVLSTQDEDGFAQYIQNELLEYDDLKTVPSFTKDALQRSFCEVFSNAKSHARSETIYTCGQYSSEKNVLKFTLLDLGEGFLKKIALFNPHIDTYLKAIDWAVKPGHSTKENAYTPETYGLQDIVNYCQTNNGSIHIASGDSYWARTGAHLTSYRLQVPFPGSLIHLIFRNL